MRISIGPISRIAIPRFNTALILFMLLPQISALAQDAPRPEDVSTLDGILNAYYEVVSGAEGEQRDWARDRSLHAPNASVGIVRTDDDGKPVVRMMTLGEYHASTGNRAFYEYEIHRVVEEWAHVTHVWSTYEWKTDLDGPAGGRGINSIQLVHDGDRWWITSWIFDGTGETPPIPDRYLPIDDEEDRG